MLNSVSELLHTLQDASDCSLRLVKCNAMRHFTSALQEDPDLQTTILQLCSAGTQGASDISTIIILAADTATMQPAALSESLAMFHTIVRLCSVVDTEHQHATQAFLENLIAHVTLPSLMSHILEVAGSLSEISWAVDMADGHAMVLSWLVLLWQCCESSVKWCCTLPASLSTDAAIVCPVLEVLLSAASAFRLPEVKTIIFRTLHLLWKGSGIRSVLHHQLSLMAEFARLLQDTSIPDTHMDAICVSQVLSVETCNLTYADSGAQAGRDRLELMMAVATDVPGLVAQAFHSKMHTAPIMTGNDLLPDHASNRERNEADLRKSCQSLRIILRSHVAGGEAASTAFCTWTVAIVESASQQAQAMLLGVGLLDPVFDRISRALHGPSQARLEVLHPEMAVLLSLATHPVFPKHAMSGLPTLCAVVQEATATGSHDTLAPVLAAIWAICRECLEKLTFSDASCLCKALLSTLPNPDNQQDQCHKSVEASEESVRSMIAAAACVALILRASRSRTPAWRRLHTSLLARLLAGLSALTHAAVCTSVAVADVLGELNCHSHARSLAPPGIQAHEFETDMSLLSLAAGIATHIIHVHQDTLLQSDRIATSGVTVISAHGPDGGTGNDSSSSMDLGALLADFYIDIVVPAHVHASTADARSCVDQDHGACVGIGMHMAVIRSLAAFLEAVLCRTHKVFLSCGTSDDTDPHGASCTDQVVQHPGLHASDAFPAVQGLPLVASATYLGWQCISYGYLVLAVERPDVPRDESHRFLQLLMATALTGHIAGGSAIIEAIMDAQPIRACSTEDALAQESKQATSPFSCIPGTDLLHSFFRCQCSHDDATPVEIATPWLNFEAAVLSVPLQQLVSHCTSWHHVCAATAGGDTVYTPGAESAANVLGFAASCSGVHADVHVAARMVDVIAAVTHATFSVTAATETVAEGRLVGRRDDMHGCAAQTNSASEAAWLRRTEGSQAADRALATIAVIAGQIEKSGNHPNGATCNQEIPLSFKTIGWATAHASPCAIAHFLRSMWRCGWLDTLVLHATPSACSCVWSLASVNGLHALASAIAESHFNDEDGSLWPLLSLLDRVLQYAGPEAISSSAAVLTKDALPSALRQCLSFHSEMQAALQSARDQDADLPGRCVRPEESRVTLLLRCVHLRACTSIVAKLLQPPFMPQLEHTAASVVDAAKLAVHMTRPVADDCDEGRTVQDTILYTNSTRCGLQKLYHASTCSCSSVLVTAITDLIRASDTWTTGDMTERKRCRHDPSQKPSSREGAHAGTLRAALDTAVELLAADMSRAPDMVNAQAYLLQSVSAVLTVPGEGLSQQILQVLVACDTVTQHSQEVISRLRYSNDTALAGYKVSAAAAEFAWQRAECTDSISLLTTAALQHFGAIPEHVRLLQSMSSPATHMIGQLEPNIRQACFTTLSVLGISARPVRNTSNPQMLISEALGQAALASLRLVCTGSNCQLLMQSQAEIGSNSSLYRMTARVGAAAGAGTSLDCTISTSQEAHEIVAEVVMLITQLSMNIDYQIQYHSSLWMAIALKIAVLERAACAMSHQATSLLGPVVSNHVILKAVSDVQLWARNTASGCQTTVSRQQCNDDDQWEDILPPLGPLQVLILLLSSIQLDRSTSSQTLSCYQQDLARGMKDALFSANMIGPSSRHHNNEKALLLIVSHLHGRIEAIQDKTSSRQDGQQFERLALSEDQLCEAQVMCMAESLLLNWMCCMVLGGCTSQPAMTEVKAWTAKVLSSPGNHNDMQAYNAAFTCTRDTSQGSALEAWLSSTHWLTSVHMLEQSRGEHLTSPGLCPMSTANAQRCRIAMVQALHDNLADSEASL